VSRSRRTEAQIIAALKQVKAGRTTEGEARDFEVETACAEGAY
jgi:hypothetical protein